MPRIIRAPAAEADAAEIWAYIAEDDAQAADRLLDRLDRMLRIISTQPQLGKAVDELVPNLRFVPVGNYLIFYRPLEDGIEIVRMLHGARDITAEFFRE
jgi:toxin ParE1/3/4